MNRTPATRKQMNDFRKRVREDFGYIVKIKTIDFTDLARCSATFATVVNNTNGDMVNGININDVIQARALANEFNIILDFFNLYTED